LGYRQRANYFGHHRALVAERVEITSVNHHCSAPFFRALVVYSHQVYSVIVPDTVIQSAALVFIAG